MTKCANCGQREGTIRWGDALALTHGFAQMWCEICATRAQLKFAYERAAAIPDLETLLAALESTGGKA